MSQKNDETSAVIGVLVMIGMALMMVAAFIAAALAFLCFIMTILAFCAWNKPLVLGEYVIEPEEARAFVFRGLIGAGLLPVFAGFSAVLFQFEIIDPAWPYLVLGGYVAGSLGIEILMEQAKEEEAARQALLPPQPERLAPLHRERAQNSESFSYASWDDEEVQS